LQDRVAKRASPGQHVQCIVVRRNPLGAQEISIRVSVRHAAGCDLRGPRHQPAGNHGAAEAQVRHRPGSRVAP